MVGNVWKSYMNTNVNEQEWKGFDKRLARCVFNEERIKDIRFAVYLMLNYVKQFIELCYSGF